MARNTRFALGALASWLAAFLVLRVGQAYDILVFRPDFHGGWWEAMWTGSVFDLEGGLAFARSTVGKVTYLGAGGLVLAGGWLFWLAGRAKG